jgi:SnoaL-like domain
MRFITAVCNPSPQPSPSGRGSLALPAEKAFPLPEGEGQGEGLQTAAMNLIRYSNRKGFPVTTLLNLHPAAAESLAKWHTMIAANDLSGLRSIVHPDAVFRSPVAHTPYKGADALALVIYTVATVFQDFTYYREAATADGLSVVLEFGAKVGGKDLKGIDFIRFGQDGKIVEFEVMVRPLSGLMALGQEMSQRLEGKLQTGKEKG